MEKWESFAEDNRSKKVECYRFARVLALETSWKLETIFNERTTENSFGLACAVRNSNCFAEDRRSTSIKRTRLADKMVQGEDNTALQKTVKQKKREGRKSVNKTVMVDVRKGSEKPTNVQLQQVAINHTKTLVLKTVL